MRKKILLSISLIILSCGEPINISNEQQQFTNTWRSYTKEYSSAGTEVQKNSFLKKGTDHINQKKSVENWYGTVTEVGSGITGDYITVKWDGIKYYLYPKGKGIDYTSINLHEELLFSGRLNGNYWLDTFKKPGLYVDCTKITNLDKTQSYFIITEEEMEKYLNDIAEKEKLNEDLEDALNELKNIFNDI